jgi:hypothetical protein
MHTAEMTGSTSETLAGTCFSLGLDEEFSRGRTRHVAAAPVSPENSENESVDSGTLKVCFYVQSFGGIAHCLIFMRRSAKLETHL